MARAINLDYLILIFKNDNDNHAGPFMNKQPRFLYQRFITQTTTLMLLIFSLAITPAYAATPSSAKSLADTLGRLPLITDVQISPDGSRIAYFQAHEGQYTLVNKSLKAGSKAKVFSMSKGEVREFFWVSNDRLVLNITVPYFSHGDDELFLLSRRMLFDVNENQLIKVFTGPKYKYTIDGIRFVSSLPNDPEHILFSYTNELYKIKISDGSREVIEKLRKSTGRWITDGNGNILLRNSYDKEQDEYIWFYRKDQQQEFQPLMVDKPPKKDQEDKDKDEDNAKTKPFDESLLGLSHDGQSMYYLAHNKDKFAAVYKAKIVANKVVQAKQLPGFEGIDAAGGTKDYYTGASNGVFYNDDYPKTDYFKLPLAQVQADLSYTFENSELDITSYDKAKKRFIAKVSGAAYGVEYYLYDTEAGTLDLLANAYPNYDKKHRGSVKRFDYSAADETKLTAYLTLPHPDKSLKKAKPPLIVLPHGGPASRDNMAFDWIRQFYAAHGFAVFQPNFRGSEGFGKVFEEAGFKQWGKKMQSDVDDGVDQLIAKGLIDKDKICIVGTSYGGYVALVGATKRPQVYKCAVSFAGISYLEDMFYFAKEQWSYGEFDYLKKSIGDRFDDKMLNKYSPVMQISDKTAPILLIHGEKDTVVPSRQSRRMYKALKKLKNHQHQFIELDNGDHWFTYGESRHVFLEKSNTFIRKHLGLTE
ncbi:MAG: dipeptidyl aminopeptidase/acylaminoacyl peptidase [Phenylobacterium sp.]